MKEGREGLRLGSFQAFLAYVKKIYVDSLYRMFEEILKKGLKASAKIEACLVKLKKSAE